jgi:predicted HicB family RNase H-like nuclease
MEVVREQQLNAAIDEGAKEPQRSIMVRLPKSMHESLKAQAQERKLSLNQLCINRLLRLPDEFASAQ